MSVCENSFIGKTVSYSYIDGYGIEIGFTDGTVFTYVSTDGGYSGWEIEHKCSGCQEFLCDGCKYKSEKVTE